MPGAPAGSTRARIEAAEADKNVAQFNAIDARVHVDLESAALGDLYKQADEMDQLNLEKYYALKKSGDDSPKVAAELEALLRDATVQKFATKLDEIEEITEEFGFKEKTLLDIFPGLERTYERTRKGLKRSKGGPKFSRFS
tara:strand:+ start:165 stop:587 length:423 start_codon:yes stop_codon:yes gene_type:complete